MATDRQMLKQVLRDLSNLNCTFFACEGSASNKVKDGLTCSRCWIEHDLRQHLKTTTAKGGKR